MSAMSKDSPDFRSSLRRAVNKADREGHPSSDMLEAFHWGDLPTDRADSVRAHLSDCAHCLDLLAQLDEIEDAATSAEVEVPPGELERSLARVRERLRAESVIADEGGARFFPRWSTAPGPYALAALALVAGIGLSFWLASRLELERQRLPELKSRLAAATARTTAAEEKLNAAQQQAAALRRERDLLLAPQANTPIVDLRVSGERGGGTGHVTEIRLPQGVKFMTLVLEDPGEAAYDEYWAVLRTREGREIGRVGPLERTPYRNFVFSFGIADLEPGEQQVTLLGGDGGKLHAVAQYRFRINPRSPGE